MFKKTLIAAALFAVGFNASAALTAVNSGAGDATKGELISVEGTAAGSSVDISALTVTSSAAAKGTYTSFDGISVALSGASFNPATSFTLTLVDSSAASSTLTPTTHFTVAFKTASRAEITITPAGVTQYGTTDGLDLTTGANVFTIGGIKVNAADIVTTGQISAVIEADSNIPGVDLEAGSGVIATGTKQFSAAVKADDGTTTGKTSTKVDVGQERTFFATATGSKSDSITATVEAAAVEVNPATTSATQKITWTLAADLSFLDADADGKLDTGTSVTVSDDNATATATGVTVAADMQSVTYISSAPLFAAGGLDDHEVTFAISTDGKRVIPETSFSVSAAMPYTDAATLAGSFAAPDMAAGSWSLNGDGAYISFLPFGPQYSQSVTITNKGTVDGEISVDWYYEGATVPTKLTSLAKGKSVTDISVELRALAAANGIVGNVAMNIVVNSPNTQISVDALYYSNTDKDRGIVATDK